jgi:hypothetical protein
MDERAAVLLGVEVLRFPSTPRHATCNSSGPSDLWSALNFDAVEFKKIAEGLHASRSGESMIHTFKIGGAARI